MVIITVKVNNNTPYDLGERKMSNVNSNTTRFGQIISNCRKVDPNALVAVATWRVIRPT